MLQGPLSRGGGGATKGRGGGRIVFLSNSARGGAFFMHKIG